MQQLYALVGFLARLASSPQREKLILKGGVLLAAFGDRRPTRDLDFHASPPVKRQRGGAGTGPLRCLNGPADGLDFDLESGRSATIREGDAYSGVRVSMLAHLAGARITFHVDVNFGDPIWPAPETVEVPRILGGPPILVSGYPLHIVLAEKLVTAIDLGTVNTRWRDFGDLWTLTRTHPVNGHDLEMAIHEVSRYRRVTLLPLLEALGGFGSHGQARWTVWRAKQRLELLPSNFSIAVTATIQFGDPVLDGQMATGELDPQIHHLASTDARITHESEPLCYSS